MNECGRNESDISRYTDVEYSPEGYKTVYRWGDFLEIARGHVYNAMDTIDLVSTGGQYEGFNPRYAYTCEFVGCSTLVDGIALFRPVSRDGEDLTQIAFLRSDIDDDTGAYTECFEAGSFDIAAASDIQCSDLGIDLLDYFRGRSFEGLSGVKRGLDGREAVRAVEVATGCDLDLFEDFWLGSPGETDVHVGPYVKRDLIALSYIVNDFSQMYGTSARDIRKLLARVNNFHPDRLAAVKAYLDCEYVTDRDTSDEKTYCWSDFLEIAGGDARYAAMLIERTAPGEPHEGLHPETLVDQDIRDGEAFMLAGRPIAPEDIYDLPGTVHGLYSELVDNVGRSGTLARDWRGFSAGTDADNVLREIDGAFGETECSRAGTVLGAYADDTFMSPFFAADDAARDVTPLTPWEDENGVAFLSRTFDVDAAAVVPCLWYCRRDEGQGFEVGGVKLDCSKIGFDEVSNEAASNGFDCVLAYLEQSISGSEPLCDIAVRRADAGRADAVKHFGRQDEALAMLSAIAVCRRAEAGTGVLHPAQQGAAPRGVPRYRGDVRIVIPGGPRVRHHARRRAHIGQHGRRARWAALLLRRRAETRARVLQGASFEDPPHRLPGNRRDLCGQPGRGPSPACIAHRDQPGRPLRIARKRAPFLPWGRAETCAGVLQAGEGQRRQEPCGDSCRSEGHRGE